MENSEDLVQRVLDAVVSADLSWHDITNTSMKDIDPESMRSIGTGFFAPDDKPRTIILSVWLDAAMISLA